MPDTDTNNKGYLNLEENTLFTKYYNALNDYKISVVTTTVSDFQKNYFGRNLCMIIPGIFQPKKETKIQLKCRKTKGTVSYIQYVYSGIWRYVP